MPFGLYAISIEAGSKNPLWLHWEQDRAILNTML